MTTTANWPRVPLSHLWFSVDTFLVILLIQDLKIRNGASFVYNCIVCTVSRRPVRAYAGREVATRKTVTIPTPTKLALHSPRAWLWPRRSPGAACMLPIAKAAPSAPWRWRTEPSSLWSAEKETQWWVNGRRIDEGHFQFTQQQHLIPSMSQRLRSSRVGRINGIKSLNTEVCVKVGKIKCGFIWPNYELIFHVAAPQSETDFPPLLWQSSSLCTITDFIKDHPLGLLSKT